MSEAARLYEVLMNEVVDPQAMRRRRESSPERIQERTRERSPILRLKDRSPVGNRFASQKTGWILYGRARSAGLGGGAPHTEAGWRAREPSPLRRTGIGRLERNPGRTPLRTRERSPILRHKDRSPVGNRFASQKTGGILYGRARSAGLGGGAPHTEAGWRAKEPSPLRRTGIGRLERSPGRQRNGIPKLFPCESVKSIGAMAADLFSSSTWFDIDSDGQERGPFGVEKMVDWYRDGYFPAHLLVRRNIHSNFITLSSLARGNEVEPIDNVHPAAKPPKVEEAELSEINGTENEEEYIEHEIKEGCFKLEIKEERIKPTMKVECFKLEIKEECIKTEIKVECLKPEIKREYLKPEMEEECTKLKIKKEDSKSAEIYGSETEEEYIEPEISEECLKLETKEECIKNEITEESIKLEVKEKYINYEIKDKCSNPELKKEYIKSEVKKEYAELKEYTSTRHEREVPDDVLNAKPGILHKIYDGKNKLKLKGETKQGAPFKEKSGKGTTVLKCQHLHRQDAFSKVRQGILKSQTRGIIKRNLSRLSITAHVHFDPVVMEIDEYDYVNPVESANVEAIIVEQLKARGIFDKFRKDCLADADKKPAYHSSGVDRIVDQLVNPELTGRIMPEVENVIKDTFGNPLTQEEITNSIRNCCNQMEKGEIHSHGADDVDMGGQGGLLNLPEPVSARKGAPFLPLNGV